MPFIVRIKRPGADAELILQASNLKDLENKLRQLPEFGLDYNFGSDPIAALIARSDLTFQYSDNQDDLRYFRNNDNLNLVKEDDGREVKRTIYLPANIKRIKELFEDELPIITPEQEAVIEIVKHNAVEGAVETTLSQDQQLIKASPAYTKAEEYYDLKKWRESKGNNLPKGDVAHVLNSNDAISLTNSRVAFSGPAGYQTLENAYREYRDHIAEGTLGKKKTQITIHGDSPADEFNAAFAVFAEPRQFKISNAVRSVFDSFFSWKNFGNPFTWATLTASAITIEAIIAAISPAALAAVAPVLTTLALTGGIVATLLAVPVGLWALINDIQEKQDEIIAAMVRDENQARAKLGHNKNFTKEDFEPSLNPKARYHFSNFDNTNVRYHLNIAAYYLKGVWNRVTEWKERHPVQFAAVTAGSVVFVLMTLFTALFLAGVPAFDFMSVLFNALPHAGLAVVAPGLSSAATAFSALFFIAAPLVFTNMVRRLFQTADEAQIAGHRLDKDSIRKQTQSDVLAEERGKRARAYVDQTADAAAVKHVTHYSQNVEPRLAEVSRTVVNVNSRIEAAENAVRDHARSVAKVESEINDLKRKDVKNPFLPPTSAPVSDFVFGASYPSSQTNPFLGSPSKEASAPSFSFATFPSPLEFVSPTPAAVNMQNPTATKPSSPVVEKKASSTVAKSPASVTPTKNNPKSAGKPRGRGASSKADLDKTSVTGVPKADEAPKSPPPLVIEKPKMVDTAASPAPQGPVDVTPPVATVVPSMFAQPALVDNPPAPTDVPPSLDPSLVVQNPNPTDPNPTNTSLS